MPQPFARTQKALGLQMLREFAVGNVPVHSIMQTFPTMEAWLKYKRRFAGNVFARPCPMRPRHGFVDSRRIKTFADFMHVWLESRAADPEAEVIIMGELHGTASAVVTPTAMTVGPGNDGATSGKAGSLMIPLSLSGISEALLLQARVENVPYFEVVFETGGWDALNFNTVGQFVQLRDGAVSAANPTLTRLITKAMVVRKVLEAQGDLLEWEALLGQHPEREGLVIHHPGGSALSHYSQHAILNDIAITFEDFPPVVGSTLEPTTEKVEPDIGAFHEGLLAGFDQAFKASYVAGSVLAMHSATSFLPEAHLARLVGVSAATLLRASCAAVLGELRYMRKTRSRSEVYSSVLSGGFASFWAKRRRFRQARELFRSPSNWRDGNFGGPKWAQCADLTFDLYRAVVMFFRDRTKGTMTEVIQASHRIINSSHNGGPLLSKFISSHYFEAIAGGDLNGTSLAGYGLWELWSNRSPASSQQLVLWQRERLSAWAGPKADGFRMQYCSIANGVHVQVGTPGRYVSADLPISTYKLLKNPYSLREYARFSLNEPQRTVYKIIHLGNLTEVGFNLLQKANLINSKGELHGNSSL